MIAIMDDKNQMPSQVHIWGVYLNSLVQNQIW